MNEQTNIPAGPLVTILMGLCNGAAHLPMQLQSIAAQSHRNWHLVCSDDGSTDQSRAIVQAFAQAHPGQVHLISGPGTGFSDNYMSMIRALPDQPGHVAFADQDDVWLADKIARGLAQLGQMAERPTLYCGRHYYWRPEAGRKAASPRMTRAFTFRNALIENVASGNTILLNPAAARVAKNAATYTGPVFAHDWWLYLLLTGSGGQVCFDNHSPAILYRQHGRNLIGAGQGVLAQSRRKIGVLRGLFAQRVDGNLKAMRASQGVLTPTARHTLETFSQARQSGPLSRLSGLMASGLYRQRRSGTLGYWSAASLGYV